MRRSALGDGRVDRAGQAVRRGGGDRGVGPGEPRPGRALCAVAWYDGVGLGLRRPRASPRPAGSTTSSSPGPSRPTPEDLARPGREQPCFRGEDDQAVAADLPGGRTQTVPIEQGPDLLAVAEDQRRRPVPRLETGRQHVLPCLAGPSIGSSRRAGDLGHERDHRPGHRPAGHDQQLEGLVERE